jgi:hypothetical protein
MRPERGITAVKHMQRYTSAAGLIRYARRRGQTSTRHRMQSNTANARREQLYESVGKSLPAGRIGEAHDVARAYQFQMQERLRKPICS